MRIRLVVIAIASMGVAVLLSACDSVVSYSVVNETDEELLTWVMFDDCKRLTTYKQDYLRTERVPPHDRFLYSDVFGTFTKPDERCVQVTTTDRRLVLAVPYSEDITLTVHDPLTTTSDPLPRRESLPSKPWREELADTWEGYVPSAVFIPLGLLGGVGAWFHYRRSRRARPEKP